MLRNFRKGKQKFNDKMSMVFRPKDSKKKKAKILAKELQISEKKAEKILESREIGEEE